jgi:hypothetical protein
VTPLSGGTPFASSTGPGTSPATDALKSLLAAVSQRSASNGNELPATRPTPSSCVMLVEHGILGNQHQRENFIARQSGLSAPSTS